MPYAEDHITLAAEYALGTLDAEEREQAEAMMAMDGEFEAIVEAWQLRLAALNQMVGPVEPRAAVWERIQAEITPAAVQAQVEALPPAPPVVVAPESVAEPPVGAALTPEVPLLAPQTPAPAEAQVIDLDRRVRRWRGVASAALALAAVLSPWLYAPPDPRRRLAWFGGATLVATALGVRAYMTAT